jgi:hypothetical protein
MVIDARVALTHVRVSAMLSPQFFPHEATKIVARESIHGVPDPNARLGHSRKAVLCFAPAEVSK